MELDEFITKTINSVIKGVKDSQEFAKKNNSLVNPLGFNDFDGATKNNTLIKFNIAVAATEEKEKG